MTVSAFKSDTVHGDVVAEVPHMSRAMIRRLSTLLDDPSAPAAVELRHGDRSERLPDEFVELFKSFLLAAGSGLSMTVVVETEGETERELSSQETADLLNVSRPHVVKLARTEELPYRKVGNRHRFLLSDVVAYKHLADHRRAAHMAALEPDEGYQPGDF